MTSYYGRVSNNLGRYGIFEYPEDKPKQAKKWVLDEATGKFVCVTPSENKEDSGSDSNPSVNISEATSKPSEVSNDTTHAAPKSDNLKKVDELRAQLAHLQDRMNAAKNEATTNLLPPADQKKIRRKKIIKKIIYRKRPTPGSEEGSASAEASAAASSTSKETAAPPSGPTVPKEVSNVKKSEITQAEPKVSVTKGTVQSNVPRPASPKLSVVRSFPTVPSSPVAGFGTVKPRVSPSLQQRSPPFRNVSASSVETPKTSNTQNRVEESSQEATGSYALAPKPATSLTKPSVATNSVDGPHVPSKEIKSDTSDKPATNKSTKKHWLDDSESDESSSSPAVEVNMVAESPLLHKPKAPALVESSESSSSSDSPIDEIDDVEGSPVLEACRKEPPPREVSPLSPGKAWKAKLDKERLVACRETLNKSAQPIGDDLESPVSLSKAQNSPFGELPASPLRKYCQPLSASKNKNGSSVKQEELDSVSNVNRVIRRYQNKNEIVKDSANGSKTSTVSSVPSASVIQEPPLQPQSKSNNGRDSAKAADKSKTKHWLDDSESSSSSAEESSPVIQETSLEQPSKNVEDAETPVNQQNENEQSHKNDRQGEDSIKKHWLDDSSEEDTSRSGMEEAKVQISEVPPQPDKSQSAHGKTNDDASDDSESSNDSASSRSSSESRDRGNIGRHGCGRSPSVTKSTNSAPLAPLPPLVEIKRTNSNKTLSKEAPIEAMPDLVPIKQKKQSETETKEESPPEAPVEKLPELVPLQRQTQSEPEKVEGPPPLVPIKKHKKAIEGSSDSKRPGQKAVETAESDSSDSSSSSDDDDDEDFHRKPWMVKAIDKEFKTEEKKPSIEKGEQPPHPQKAAARDEDESSVWTNDSGDSFYRKQWMVEALEKNQSTGVQKGQDVAEDIEASKENDAKEDEEDASDSSSSDRDSFYVKEVGPGPSKDNTSAPKEPEETNERTKDITENKPSTFSKKPRQPSPLKTFLSKTDKLKATDRLSDDSITTEGTPEFTRLNQLRRKRDAQQARVQSSLGSLRTGNETMLKRSIPKSDNEEPSCTPSDTMHAKSDESTPTCVPASATVTNNMSDAKTQYAAQQANLAMAVLSYLKFSGLDNTAQSFLAEWYAVHGEMLLNQSVVMGTIRWEPLLPDGFPTFTMHQAPPPVVAETTTSTQPPSTPNADPTDHTMQATERAARRSSLKNNAQGDDVSRGVRRSVSFDGHDAQVKHIPRYSEDVKQNCFYNKLDIDRMRFDHQLEKQREQTEQLMKFVEISSKMMRKKDDRAEDTVNL